MKTYTIFDEAPDIYSRNDDGRILFRYNGIDDSFAIFRSIRMNDDEKFFIFSMYDILKNKKSFDEIDGIFNALEYSTDKDLTCT